MQKTAEIIQQLSNEGWDNARIIRELGMSEDEINRLKVLSNDLSGVLAGRDKYMGVHDLRKVSMAMHGPYVELEVEVKRETDLAMLVLCEGIEVWIPRSQIHTIFSPGVGETMHSIEIPEWLAKQEGLT